MTPIEAAVAEAARARPEHWAAGPIDFLTSSRFATASGDRWALERLSAPSPTAPPLLLSSVLDWTAADTGSDADTERTDGLSRHEAPFLADHDVRIIHGGQSIRWYRPVRVGETGIVATRRVHRAQVRTGRTGPLAIIDLATRFVTPGVGPIATCRETILGRAADVPEGPSRSTDEVVLGGVRVEVEDVFTRSRLLQFSAATWNSHLIHVDECFARGQGFDGVVVQSSLHGIMVLRAALASFGPRSPHPDALSWRNIAPAYAGQRLRSAVTSVEASPGGVRLDVVEWNDAGTVTARGWVEFAGGPTRRGR